MPYVFFALAGRDARPARRARPAGPRRCPATGIPAGETAEATVSPKTPAEGRTSGQHLARDARAGRAARRPSRAGDVEAAACATRSTVRSRGPGRRSAARGARCRPCRTRARRAPRAAGARDGVEQPRDLRPGEVRVAARGRSARGPAARARRRACARRAARCAGTARRSPGGPAAPVRAVPEERRLPLVRDADGGDVARRDAPPRCSAAARRVELRPPDLLGIVLDPARLGKVLRELPVTPAAHAAVLTDDERRRAGRPLVEREDRPHDGRGSAGARAGRLGAGRATSGRSVVT